MRLQAVCTLSQYIGHGRLPIAYRRLYRKDSHEVSKALGARSDATVFDGAQGTQACIR